MKLKDILTKEVWEKYGDMDVTNDCIDDTACAWCGNYLTKEGRIHFEEALEYEAEIVHAMGEFWIQVKIDHLPGYEHAWTIVKRLFLYMAGYCPDEDYNRWFTEVEEPEVPKNLTKAEFIKQYVEPMLVAANCGIKHATYYKHDKPYIDDKYRTHYSEEVVIEYNNGWTRLVNVECDSLAAMVEDIYKQGGVY